MHRSSTDTQFPSDVFDGHAHLVQLNDSPTQFRRQRAELWVLDVGDGTLVGRVCHVLGCRIGLIDAIV